MKLKKLLALVMIAVLVLTSFTGCKKEESTSGEGLSGKINELAWTVDKVIDMPDWTGKKLNLVQWFSQGTASPYIGKQPTDTTIHDEFTRISGISWDKELSFDNSGFSPDAKVAKILATNTWPDVGYNIQLSLIERLAEGDYIWDLTELIPKYMPNLMKIMNYNEKSKIQFEAKKMDGKFWYVPKPTWRGPAVLDPDYSEEKYAILASKPNTRTTIAVRDDVLRMIYPNAYTRDELEQIYVERGEFTLEEMTDVTIDSLQEFDEFVRKIDALNLTQDGRKVFAFYTHNGTDNWDIARTLAPNLNGGACAGAPDYFGYFDREQGKLVRTIDQDWFKETIRVFTKLVADGVASQEALIDTKATFDQKKNAGQYAILYGSASAPSREVLKAAGRTYMYRPVIIDIKPKYEKFSTWNTTENYASSESFVLFKTGQLKTEEDVEQVLRYFDYFYTPIGCKTFFWGPEDSGLYTEDENGVLRYTDELLEQDMVYSGANKRKQYYGMNSWPDLENYMASGGAYNPKVVYGESKTRIGKQYSKKYKYSEFEAAPTFPELFKGYTFYNWTEEVPGIKKFWDARQSSEDALKRVFTAKTDEEFEMLYAELITTYEKNGYDEKTLEDWNKAFKEKNASLYDDFVNWKPYAE